MMIPAIKSAVILKMSEPAITLVMKGSVELSSAISRSYSSSSSAIPSSRRRLSEIFLLYTSFSLIFRAFLANSEVCLCEWMSQSNGAKASAENRMVEPVMAMATTTVVGTYFMAIVGGSLSLLRNGPLLHNSLSGDVPTTVDGMGRQWWIMIWNVQWAAARRKPRDSPCQ